MTAHRVWLHAGLPKTGTTFLQTVMWRNRAHLREQRWLYPGERRFDHYRAFRQAERRRSGEPPSGGAWDRLVEEIAGFDGTALISHEFFSMLPPGKARAALDDLAPAEVRVVVTVRSYVRQMPAVWQEALKMHSTASFDEFMKDIFTSDQPRGAWSWHSQDVGAVLKRWSEVLPSNRIHVVTVPPPDAPRDLLWRRWCETVGIVDDDFDLDLSFANESLGAVQAALLHRVKPHLGESLRSGPDKHRWVRGYLGHEVLVPLRGERFLPRPRQRERLLRRAQHAVDTITGGDFPVTGDLADFLDPGPPGGGPHPDDVGAEEMLDVAVRAIETMVRDVQRLSRELAEARARAQPPRWRRRLARLRRTARRRVGLLRRGGGGAELAGIDHEDEHEDGHEDGHEARGEDRYGD